METTETTGFGRNVVAAIVGVILIVILVFVAKWTGDKIREKFSKPKPEPIVVSQQIPSGSLLTDNIKKTATYSAIPKTGPNDWLYAVVGIMFISGLGIKFVLQ